LASEPIEARARLESVDDDGRRALLRQRVISRNAGGDDAMVADLFAILPARGGKAHQRKQDPKKQETLVVPGARLIARWELAADAGLAFALLTGDFNPLHWIRPYARALGFQGTILHGFAAMARAIEGIQKALFDGAVDRVGVWDMRFTKPLLLPARVGLFVEDQRLFVGDEAGGPAYVSGSWIEKQEERRVTASGPVLAAEKNKEQVA
jgi:acyl dehydratase